MTDTTWRRRWPGSSAPAAGDVEPAADSREHTFSRLGRGGQPPPAGLIERAGLRPPPGDGPRRAAPPTTAPPAASMAASTTALRRRRRRAVQAALLGLVLLLGIAGGLLWLALSGWGDRPARLAVDAPPAAADPDLARRVAALEAAVRDLEARLRGPQPDPAAQGQAAAGAIDEAANARLDGLEQRVATLARVLATLGDGPRPAAPPAPGAPAPASPPPDSLPDFMSDPGAAAVPFPVARPAGAD